MKITLTPSRTIPHPTVLGALSLRTVPIEVEVDRIVHDGRHNGYCFVVKDSEVQRLQSLQDAGNFDSFKLYQHFTKKCYPEMRIPAMKRGQQVRILDTPDGFRCGPIESEKNGAKK